jgi:RimJ/RimL family protein N-acetyltransferase
MRMLRGEKVGLRARHESDIAILQTELYDDVATHARADGRAWRPISPGSDATPYRIRDPSDDRSPFSVIQLADGELAGDALLWNIDLYNRQAHIGISLLPAVRGRGLGTDVVQVLCRYGFAVLGLHRLQIETLADNRAMIQAATRAGFVAEGTLRRSAWSMGQFIDQVIFGLLADEWPG